LTVSRLKAKSRKIRERLDKASIVKRHEAAASDRHVELDPVEDGMAWLHLYVEAPVAVAMYQAATDVARSLQGPDESRTLAQLRADVLATMILTGGDAGTSDPAAESAVDRKPEPGYDDDEFDDAAGSAEGTEGETGPEPQPKSESEPAVESATGLPGPTAGEPAPSPDTSGETGSTCSTPANPLAHIRPQVAIMVPALSLLGLSNEPVILEGFGPIDMDTARRLVGNATSFTRILTHPETGTILSVGRKKYRVPKALKRWLEFRDQTCTKPGCNAPARQCDLDHLEEWQNGGDSSVYNLAHLCPKHHAEIHHTGWKHVMTPSGIEWTSPTGKKYITTHELDIRTG
jgi:hypothetical protein